jgi:CxxC-x17-CxxC domain-containing protein
MRSEREIERPAGAPPEFQNKRLTCAECASEFDFTPGEQTFFHDKGLKNTPKRCKPCRAEKPRTHEGLETKAAHVRAEERSTEPRRFEIVCDKCGASDTVPFYPSQGRPVLCRNCFRSQ